MPAAIGQYFSGLANYVGSSWNRFWFLPSDVFGLCVQRIACGVLAIVWQLSFTPHLVTWFGTKGWFDAGLYRSWVLDESVRTFSGRLSYLFVSSDSMLWTLHIAGTIVLAAFSVGLWTRITSILSLVVVLAYIHRAPFLSGPAEPVLTMMIGYLCLAPWRLLVARRLAARSGGTTGLVGVRDAGQPLDAVPFGDGLSADVLQQVGRCDLVERRSDLVVGHSAVGSDV
jgi:hypothetical protein